MRDGRGKMGQIYVNINVKGEKGTKKMENILVDTGATYTVLPKDVLKKIRASSLGETEIELGNGKRIKAEAYGLRIRIEDREAPSIAITFKGAKKVIGSETLESLGLRVNPTTGKLEETRPKGLAYFYLSKDAIK
jgi:clan AA aspartic protease